MRKTLVLLSLFCFFVEVSRASAQDNTTQDGANLSDQSYQRSANKVYPIRSSNSEVAANKRDLVKKEKLKHRKEVNQLKVNQSRVGSEPVNKNHDLDHSVQIIVNLA